MRTARRRHNGHNTSSVRDDNCRAHRSCHHAVALLLKGGGETSHDTANISNTPSSMVPDHATYARIQQQVDASPGAFWEPMAQRALHWHHAERGAV